MLAWAAALAFVAGVLHPLVYPAVTVSTGEWKPRGIYFEGAVKSHPRKFGRARLILIDILVARVLRELLGSLPRVVDLSGRST